MDLVDDWFHAAWFAFTGSQIEDLVDWVPFEAERNWQQIQADRINERLKHWSTPRWPPKTGHRWPPENRPMR
jgi:hypothetical protein